MEPRLLLIECSNALLTGRRRNNLPAELTSFVGRRSELSEVKRLLSQTRLLPWAWT